MTTRDYSIAELASASTLLDGSAWTEDPATALRCREKAPFLHDAVLQRLARIELPPHQQQAVLDQASRVGQRLDGVGEQLQRNRDFADFARPRASYDASVDLDMQRESMDAAIARSKALRIDFLLIDLDLANTFLDCAALATVPGSAALNQARARVAHDSVARLLSRTVFTAAQLAWVAAPLVKLKRRLEAAGETF